VVEEKRAEASSEVADTVRAADEQLSQQGSAAQSELESSVDGLSAKLASRILGIDVKPDVNTSGSR
jgi:F-type H+-transporting ATPase subunit b